MGKAKPISWFDEFGQEHNDPVGKKGANPGEMVNKGGCKCRRRVHTIVICRKG